MQMKTGVLFSGGKDSMYASFLAKENGHTLSALLTMDSQNLESYMFHTPSITQVKKQAEVMNTPLIIKETKGEKEIELKDLIQLIQQAKQQYNIQAIVTGTVESIYQSTRIQTICDNLDLECFNPLWQKNQIELLHDLIKNNFKILITGVFAYPLTKEWVGKIINESLIKEVINLNEKYCINPAGEGGEFESFVLNCPLFSRPLTIKEKKITGNKNSWTMEIDVI
ncbi:MAG: diphthine--ammonia ligase [Thermoplasmatota archaeon]